MSKLSSSLNQSVIRGFWISLFILHVYSALVNWSLQGAWYIRFHWCCCQAGDPNCCYDTFQCSSLLLHPHSDQCVKITLAHSASTTSWTGKQLAVCMNLANIWLLSKDHWPVRRQNVSRDKHLVNMVVAFYSVTLKIYQHVFIKGSIVSLNVLPRHYKLPTAVIFDFRRHGPKTCWSQKLIIELPCSNALMPQISFKIWICVSSNDLVATTQPVNYITCWLQGKNICRCIGARVQAKCCILMAESWPQVLLWFCIANKDDKYPGVCNKAKLTCPTGKVPLYASFPVAMGATGGPDGSDLTACDQTFWFRFKST